MRQIVLAFIGAACLVATGCASSHHAEQAAPAPDSAVAGFHWVAGHWVDTGRTGRYEEGWFGERGGAMTGMFRLIGKRGPIVYEFMRVANADDRIVMEITHFGGNGKEWPNQPVVFRSTSVEDDRIEFVQDGVANKTLVYERTGKDAMRVTLNDPADAGPSVFEFVRKD